MHNQRGFSLLEVLVVSLVGLGILAGFTSLYLSGQGTYLQTAVQLQSQRDAALISDEFALRAHMASTATLSGGGATVQFINFAGGNTYLFASSGGPTPVFLENGTALVFSKLDSLGFSAAGKQVTMGLVVSDKYNQKLRIMTTAVMRN